MSEIDDQTRPKLYRAGGIAIDSMVADPSVALIEMGDEFGFLLSESADDAFVDSRLRLERVLWAKANSPSGFFEGMFGGVSHLVHRPLDLVEVYRHELGPFVVRDSEMS